MWRFSIWLLLTTICCASSVKNPSIIRMSMSQEDDAHSHVKLKNENDAFRAKDPPTPVQFSVAKVFQNNMVLQRAPNRARVFGFSPDIGAKVMAQMITPTKMYYYGTTVVDGPAPGVGSWAVTLDAMNITDPVTIKFVSHLKSVTLKNVLFGDVWLCSGQSNMEFTVAQMLNGAQEAHDAANYPNIRLFTVSKITSTTPLYDLEKIDEAWTQPSVSAVSNAPWTYFSSVCWLYGKALHQILGYPIGLVATDWGGTTVETWSSPDALAKCHMEQDKPSHMDRVFDNLKGPQADSLLWNAMINPMLGMSIYGAIWYQGEDDSRSATHMNHYNCTFPAMIQDWRSKFSTASLQQTSSVFPFGFVQLAPNRPDPNITVGFPDIRWHQTADMGTVPNSKMPNTFMAVAMDLPDYNSTYGSIHPRDKEDVGRRLSLAGLAVAYNVSVGPFQGPLPIKGEFFAPSTITLEYDKQYGPIQIRNVNGFEVQCQPPSSPALAWYPITILTHTTYTVSFNTTVCGGGPHDALRYAWKESPCPFKACAIYSTVNDLPGPPFSYPFTTKSHGRIVLDIK